jgi:hypothetical protein
VTSGEFQRGETRNWFASAAIALKVKICFTGKAELRPTASPAEKYEF